MEENKRQFFRLFIEHKGPYFVITVSYNWSDIDKFGFKRRFNVCNEEKKKKMIEGCLELQNE